MSKALKIIVIAGASYALYRAVSANEAYAADIPGAGIIARPIDNSRPAQLSADQVAEICAAANAENGDPFDVADLMAICFVESSWRPAAYRYEARLDDASYGLFQTLFATAREMGFDGSPDGLFDPATSAFYGVKYLVWCRDYMGRQLGRAPSWLEILSAYNGGPGRAAKGWRAIDYHAKFVQARRGISQ